MDELVLNWTELQHLPMSWKLTLGQWRAIYHVFDTHSRRGYVGSAYGEQNLLQRWQEYAASSHGGNVGLQGLDARNFRFSILQLLAPDLDATDVIVLENT